MVVLNYLSLFSVSWSKFVSILIDFGLMSGHGSLLRALWVHFGTPLKITKNYENALFYVGGNEIYKKTINILMRIMQLLNKSSISLL